MKPKAIASALVAMSMAMGAFPVFGQAEGNEQDRQRNNQRVERAMQPQAQHGKQQQGQRNNQQQGQRSNQQQSQRGNQQQGPYGHDQRGDGRQDERGAGPDHNYHRGDRLPAEYRHHNYVVNDWRGHGLSAPPRGYQWVQTGSDYVLVAIATGIILQLLLNN